MMNVSDMIAAIQVIVVAAGFFCSVMALRATRQSISIAAGHLNTAVNALELERASLQAKIFNDFVVQGRDLQFKFAATYHDSDSKDDIQKRRQLFIGSVISYYAACFEMREILPFPDSKIKLFDAELRELLSQPEFRAYWDTHRGRYSKEFNSYVASLPGV